MESGEPSPSVYSARNAVEEACSFVGYWPLRSGGLNPWPFSLSFVRSLGTVMGLGGFWRGK
jgi:hypothetical protein